MSRRCTICDHPKLKEINKLLLDRRNGWRNIASQYGTSAATLIRHHDDHIPERLAKAQGIKDLLDADDLLGQVKQMQEQAYRVLADASGPLVDEKGVVLRPIKDAKVALMAIKMGQDGVRLLGEVLGKLKPAGGVNLNLGLRGEVVIYQLPDNGRGQTEKRRLLDAFRARYGALPPGIEAAASDPTPVVEVNTLPVPANGNGSNGDRR